ncbi:MAG: hypothetical protein V5A47_11005 [Bacteroidales bacterium]
MISIGKVHEILASQQPIDLKCWKDDGEVLEGEGVICTSSYYKNNTANIRWPDSGEIRKISVPAIFEINKQEVML